LAARRPNGPGPTIDKSAGIGRILKDLYYGRDGGFFPDDVPEPVSSGNEQALIVEKPQYLGSRCYLKEGSEDHAQTALNLLIRVFSHGARLVPDKPNG